jgi:hypothetical protein
MESLKDFLPILLALLYFLLSGLGSKKKKQNAPPKRTMFPDRQEGTLNEEKPPLTFEELLREISGGRPIEEVEQEYESYEEELSQVPDKYQAYTGSITDAEPIEIKKLDDQVEIPEGAKKLKVLYEGGSGYNADRVRKMLQSKDGLKDAVVLAEILNPKYF